MENREISPKLCKLICFVLFSIKYFVCIDVEMMLALIYQIINYKYSKINEESEAEREKIEWKHWMWLPWPWNRWITAEFPSNSIRAKHLMSETSPLIHFIMENTYTFSDSDYWLNNWVKCFCCQVRILNFVLLSFHTLAHSSTVSTSVYFSNQLHLFNFN